jgi:hypothetical protein
VMQQLATARAQAAQFCRHLELIAEAAPVQSCAWCVVRGRKSRP